MKATPGKSRIQEAYQEDLAFIHDAGFSRLAEAAALQALEELKRSGINHGCVVELGCGSGVSSHVFRKAGFDVVGFDVSEPLIRLARERVPDAEFHVASFVAAPIPRCVAVTAIGEVLNYSFDPENSFATRGKLFQRICAALDPGGLLIFDLAEPSRAPANGVQRSFVLEEDWAVLVETEANSDKTVLTRRITSFRKQDELYQRSSETHRLQLVERAEIVQQLQCAGFSLQVIESYGPQLLLSGTAGFFARKSSPPHSAEQKISKCSSNPSQKSVQKPNARSS